MKDFIETERLILRPFVATDAEAMFELDSNPKVHEFLGKKPVTDMEQCRKTIANIQRQYIENGMGRWAVILKETGEFIGWSGLKLECDENEHEQFYDLGYRFIERFWGKGYGYESAKAFIDYGFNVLKIDIICASFEKGNTGSQRIMEKCGMHFVNDFIYSDGSNSSWYEIKNPK